MVVLDVYLRRNVPNIEVTVSKLKFGVSLRYKIRKSEDKVFVPIHLRSKRPYCRSGKNKVVSTTINWTIKYMIEDYMINI